MDPVQTPVAAPTVVLPPELALAIGAAKEIASSFSAGRKPAISTAERALYGAGAVAGIGAAVGVGYLIFRKK